MKGLYDTREPGQSFIVTGPARFDVYRATATRCTGAIIPTGFTPLPD